MPIAGAIAPTSPMPAADSEDTAWVSTSKPETSSGILIWAIMEEKNEPASPALLSAFSKPEIPPPAAPVSTFAAVAAAATAAILATQTAPSVRRCPPR
jgi:hypothetical protein